MDFLMLMRQFSDVLSAIQAVAQLRLARAEHLDGWAANRSGGALAAAEVEQAVVPADERLAADEAVHAARGGAEEVREPLVAACSLRAVRAPPRAGRAAASPSTCMYSGALSHQGTFCVL